MHGSSTAGGAYMPGLSDYVIMVRGRAGLPGRPAAAEGRHRRGRHRRRARRCRDAHHVSGLGEYLAEDDADALRIAREVLERLKWGTGGPPSGIDADPALEPHLFVRRTGRRDAAGLPRGRSTCARSSPASSTVRSSPSSAPTTAAPRCAAMPRCTASRSASSPTTGPSTRPAPTRPRTSSRAAARPASRCCTCRTPPATSSARPASRPA